MILGCTLDLYLFELHIAIRNAHTFQVARHMYDCLAPPEEGRATPSGRWREIVLEVGCGTAAGLVVAPAVSIVDQAIFCNASGKEGLFPSIQRSLGLLLRHPLQFIRGPAFLWLWVVYGSTYITANVSERLCIQHARDYQTAKFVTASAVNISMSVLKDRSFSRMFGTGLPRPLPPTAALCYAARDLITVGASFSLVEPLGRWTAKNVPGVSVQQSTFLAQLSMPLLAQVVNTPIFLYGMNLYNNPGSTTAQHKQFMTANYIKTLAGRVMRIAPAFSIGGVFNRAVRQSVFQS